MAVPLVLLVSLRSPESQRSCRHSIDDFVCWYCSEPRLSFNKTVVTRYRIHLEDMLLAPGTINVRLAAVRRLAYEAADTGLLSPDLAAGIRRVKGAKKLGMRLGNWLTVDEARSLWQLPNTHTVKGKRDRAILAVLLGCGLRRKGGRMKRILRFCLLAGFGAASMTAGPRPPQKTSMEGSRANRSNATIEGLVRDIACPIQNLDGNATHLSMKCALACARAGSPIAILTKDGDLYLPISDKMPDYGQRQKLMPFVGKYVRVNGIVFERNGTHAIVITKTAEMKEVHVTLEGE